VPVDPLVDLRSVRFWDELVQRDPGAAGSIGEQAENDTDATVRALARNARARSMFDVGSIDRAAELARLAVRAVGDGVDDTARRAVLMSSAVILAESGDVGEGLAALDRFEHGDDVTDDGRVELQRAYILYHAGRLNDSLAHVDIAERLLRVDPDARDLMRLHSHRGVVLLQQGRMEPADDDFRAAAAIAHEMGFAAAEAQIIANRAILAGRARRLVAAVELFRSADELYTAAGRPVRSVATTEIDRAEVLMHSGLVADAVDAARSARELVGPTGNQVLIGDAQLVVARTELAAGLLRVASRSAEAAAAVFTAAGRLDMVPQAHSVGASASLRAVGEREHLVPAFDDTDRLLVQLRQHGWQRQAEELALERVRAADRLEALDLVRAELEELRAASSSQQRDLALVGALAESLLLRQEGDLTGALGAVRRGFDRLDDIIAEAPTLEDRSAAFRLGADLSRITIDIAVELDDAETVLAAAEGTRARALHEELDAEGRHWPLTDVGAVALSRELASRLGARTLVEWIVVRDQVVAVVLDGDGSRLVRVASLRDVVRARDRVLVHLDVAAAEPDGSSSRAVRAAAMLDELLFGRLGLSGDAGVVMVPVDSLHGVPWAGLPTLCGRSFSLTPSARIWLEADRRSGTPARSVGLVIGPDVVGAATEREAVERWHPSAAIASGAAASASTVASMLAGYGLVHVAAHGCFRADRPLLSTLRLADGEATLHDSVPDRVDTRIVVLSSCEGGAQGSSDGAEVLGLGAVLLARGAASVVAPLTAVRDLECGEFVADLHAELAAGEPVACALAAVRRRWLADDDLSRWAVASAFSCFGSGASRIAT
jgi:tetratricopeptide (TPR) repeat protein